MDIILKENKMQQELIRKNVTIVLRLIGTVITFVGLILVTVVVFQAIGAQSAASQMKSAFPELQVSMKGATQNLGIWVITGYASIAVWGLILCAASKGLAATITSYEEP